jgi:trimethylamine:corrinoid methyltransferase-like protein
MDRSLPRTPFTVVEEQDLRAIHDAAVRVLVEVGRRVMTEVMVNGLDDVDLERRAT